MNELSADDLKQVIASARSHEATQTRDRPQPGKHVAGAESPARRGTAAPGAHATPVDAAHRGGPDPARWMARATPSQAPAIMTSDLDPALVAEAEQAVVDARAAELAVGAVRGRIAEFLTQIDRAEQDVALGWRYWFKRHARERMPAQASLAPTPRALLISVLTPVYDTDPRTPHVLASRRLRCRPTPTGSTCSSTTAPPIRASADILSTAAEGDHRVSGCSATTAIAASSPPARLRSSRSRRVRGHARP